ncbi:MAG TPA: VOC family protein [Gaiellales bacterium]|nr:VOC family protein [Gaiellales bacterium]
MQTVTPYLLYEDAAAALEFLQRAFAFQEITRMETPDGRVSHAEMRIGNGEVHLGQPDEPTSPRRLGGTAVLVYVVVEDVDAHFAQAKAAGAKIVDEPADQHYGDRRYAAHDPEGHVWYFAQPTAG